MIFFNKIKDWITGHDPIEEKLQDLCAAYEKREALRAEVNKYKNRTERHKDAMKALAEHTFVVMQLEREVGIL